MAAPKVEEKKSDDKPIYEATSESQYAYNEEDLALLEKIKAKFGDRLTPLYPFVIRMFIRGYAHCEDREKETFERIDHYLETHDKYQFPTILDEALENEDQMIKAWTVYMYGYDCQGHPVIYDEIACCDTNLMVETFEDNEAIKQYRYRFHRRVANAKRIQSDKLDTILYQHCLVFDLSGLKRDHIKKKYQEIAKEVIGDEQNIFPESLYKCFLINAPKIFLGAWKIVSKFVDPLTKEKIKVLGKNYLEEMQKTIPIDQIPPKYGGKGKVPIKMGYSADLPHDRYPLDYIKKQTEKSNEAKGAEYEAKEQ